MKIHEICINILRRKQRKWQIRCQRQKKQKYTNRFEGSFCSNESKPSAPSHGGCGKQSRERAANLNRPVLTLSAGRSSVYHANYQLFFLPIALRGNISSSIRRDGREDRTTSQREARDSSSKAHADDRKPCDSCRSTDELSRIFLLSVIKQF